MGRQDRAGVSKVGALKRTTEVVKHRAGGDEQLRPQVAGPHDYDAIMLERGITHDHEFETWANMVASCRAMRASTSPTTRRS